MMRRITVLLFIYLTLQISPAWAQTPLRWKFTAGETLQYLLTLRTTNLAASGGGGLTTTLQIGLQQKVESVDAARVASITQTIARIHVRIDSASGASEYDTTSGKKPEGMVQYMGPMLHAVLNKPVRFKLGPSGQIAGLTLVKGKAEEIKKAVGGDELGRLFSEAGIAHLLGVIPLPEEPLSPGARWPQAVTMSNPVLGKQSVETVYTFQGVENRSGQALARITSTSQTSFPEGSQQSVVVKILEQNTHGTAYFDPATGRLVESEQEERMRLQVTFSGKIVNQDRQMTRQVRLVTAAPSG